MIRALYRQPDGTIEEDLGEQNLRTALASGQGLLWVDLESVTRQEGELLSSVFSFHHLAIDDCFNRHVDPPKVDDYRDYIFVIAQAVSYAPSDDRLEMTELDLFLGANFVVSFHALPLTFVDELYERIKAKSPESMRGADRLAHALLDLLVDAYQPEVDQLDDKLTAIEEQVLADPEPGLLQEILLLKHNTQRLRRTILPQRDVMNRFSRGEFATVVSPETNIYFRDIYDHVVRVEEMIESVRELADGVLSTYLSSLNVRMNDVMKTLSVVATVLLPLTFIASIYGMNFENMPELGWRYGYFLALGFMLAVAAGLVALFRVRRWF